MEQPNVTYWLLLTLFCWEYSSNNFKMNNTDFLFTMHCTAETSWVLAYMHLSLIT